MAPRIDFATEGILQKLHLAATAGSGRSPLHNQGVLDVVSRVRRDGRLERDPLIPIITLFGEEPAGGRLLSDEERAEATRILAGRGWTAAQGFEYARGVSAAEDLIGRTLPGGE
jgi:hypothetical protein